MKDDQLYMDLIYLMIDGEASEVERQALFSALNENPELQSEFQNAIDINNAGKSFAASNEVPMPLTNSLFDKAGLTYTGASHIGRVPVKTKVAAGFSSGAGLLGRFGKLLVTKYGYGVLGLMIGGLIGFYIFGSSGETNTNQSEMLVAEREAAASQTETVEKPDVPTVYSKASEDNSSGIQNSDVNYKSSVISGVFEPETRMISNNTSVTESTETIAEERQAIDIIPFDYNYEANSIGRLRINKSMDLFQLSNIEYDELTNLINEPEGKKSFGIELNSSFFWNLPKETVSPDEIAKLHNMNMFLYYYLNSNLSVGIGARQETFYVKYNTSDELTRDFIYEQQPNLTNYEVSIRYSPLETTYPDPFFQVNLGGGEFGYTYRFGAGARLGIYDNLAFTLYLEYASLMYNHRSNWYTARKIGVNYGINYTF